MKSLLLRICSVPVQHHSFVPGSPKVSLTSHDSIAGIFSGEKNGPISLHLDVGRRRGIRRSSSDSDVILSESGVSGGFPRLNGAGSQSFPARIPENDSLSYSEGEAGVGGIGFLISNERDFDRRNYAGDCPESGIPVEELGFSSGGVGKGRKSGGGGDCSTGTSNGGNADRRKIGAYYQEMLKSNPTNSLLLINYGRFLHEVERDMVKAEEYYGRAILASPGDGEVLSLYGKLIWESQRDEVRAKSYFDQAFHASPNDCMVLGSYAHFMWEAEAEAEVEADEEEEEEDDRIEREKELSVSAMGEAF